MKRRGGGGVCHTEVLRFGYLGQNFRSEKFGQFPTCFLRSARDLRFFVPTDLPNSSGKCRIQTRVGTALEGGGCCATGGGCFDAAFDAGPRYALTWPGSRQECARPSPRHASCRQGPSCRQSMTVLSSFRVLSSFAPLRLLHTRASHSSITFEHHIRASHSSITFEHNSDTLPRPHTCGQSREPRRHVVRKAECSTQRARRQWERASKTEGAAKTLRERPVASAAIAPRPASAPPRTPAPPAH